MEVDSPVDRDTVDDLSQVYLVDEAEAEPDREQLLRRYYAVIFAEQLALWYRAEKLWPKPRSREQFDAWFDVRLIEIIFDLSKKALRAS